MVLQIRPTPTQLLKKNVWLLHLILANTTVWKLHVHEADVILTLETACTAGV